MSPWNERSTRHCGRKIAETVRAKTNIAGPVMIDALIHVAFVGRLARAEVVITALTAPLAERVSARSITYRSARDELWRIL